MPVNGFSLAKLIVIATIVDLASCSSFWDSTGASYSYSTGIASIPHCIIAETGIHTLLGAIHKAKKINSRIIQQSGSKSFYLFKFYINK